MKAFLIAFLTVSAFCSSLKGQWEVINEGYAFRLIDFVSDDIGWMVTEDTILKTVDGGETWVPDPWNLWEDYPGIRRIDDMDFEIHDVIDFVNDSVGWILTRLSDESDGYGLFKTVDGGKSWKICIDRWKLGLEYVAEDMVIVSGGPYYLSKSTDGGITWVDITPSERVSGYNSLNFVGSDTGIYVVTYSSSSGTKFNRTFDGGRTWRNGIFAEFAYISEIGYIDNQNGYFIAHRTSDGAKVICKTDDAFDTWTVVYESQYRVHSCHFFNSDSCIALMEDSIGCNILKSYDGGLSWFEPISLRLPGSEYYDVRLKIKFNNHSDGIIYSGGHISYGSSILLKSIDSGNTWSMLNLSYPFHDVNFINDQKGFVVGGLNGAAGNFGDILWTMDGGRSWKVLRSNIFAIVNCEFFNDSVGFVSNPWSGGILHADQFSSNLFQTTDGGESWIEYIHPFDQFTGFKILNEQIGFALNDSGMFMTKSGGDSWDLMLSSELCDSLNVNPSCFISTTASDENTFWTISGDRSIIRFTGEGVWERIEIETGQDLYKIFFKDEYTGWILSGGYMACWYGPDDDPTMHETKDGGESWFRIDNPYQFRDIFFTDSQHGWAVGMDSLDQGVILETINGGEDWIVQVDSLSGPLNGIEYKDGIAWAVGENGLILKKVDSTNTSIGNHYVDVKNSTFFRIFPNPTSSYLNIESNIQGDYTIELVNLNGQLLMSRTLAGSKQQLDISTFRNGIYFITFRSKYHVQTKRFIKL